jgi:thymidylate kinase
MSLIYITGISGSGKSSVCTELKRRGYSAYDTDKDGIAFFYHNDTGKAVTEKVAPESRTPEWRSNHTWKAKREDVEKLVAESKDKPVFLCGVTSNDSDELWDLFDSVFALTVDKKTLEHRIANRTSNDFGKNPHELADLLRWQQTASSDYKQLGAILIDATKPLNAVVDEITKQVPRYL